MPNPDACQSVLVNQEPRTETTLVAKALKDFPLTTDTGTFVPASNAFGFRLLSMLAQGSGNGNVFLSPLSLSLALTMTMDGAGGATRQQMQTALGYRAGDAPGAIDADARALLARYQGGQISSAIAANIASALWSNAKMPPDQGHLNPAFAARAAGTFGAPVRAVNFANASGARQVNAWTREHTRGKVASILPEAPMPDTALMLTNAVYFKARWNQRFYPEDTEAGAFTLSSGQKKMLPMMHQTAFFAYLEGAGFQALHLPYDDGRFSLYLLLPERGLPIRTFIAREFPTSLQWDGSLKQFTPTKVALQTPRFKLAYDAGELAPPLSALGMVSALSPSADFRPMGFKKARISSVRHKTTLVVDESGSEATVITSVATHKGMSAAPRLDIERIVSFVVDRPFACALRDNATGALLFLGLITNPETA